MAFFQAPDPAEVVEVDLDLSNGESAKATSPEQLARLLAQVYEPLPPPGANARKGGGLSVLWQSGGGSSERAELWRKSRHLATRREAAAKLLQALEDEVANIESELAVHEIARDQLPKPNELSLAFFSCSSAQCPCEQDGGPTFVGGAGSNLRPGTVELRSTLRARMRQLEADLALRNAELERMRHAFPNRGAAAGPSSTGSSPYYGNGYTDGLGLPSSYQHREEDVGHLEGDEGSPRQLSAAQGISVRSLHHGPFAVRRVVIGACGALAREADFAAQGVCFAAWRTALGWGRRSDGGDAATLAAAAGAPAAAAAAPAAAEPDPKSFTPDGRPLPEGWQCAIDAQSGHAYYYNHSTGVRQWAVPEGTPQEQRTESRDRGFSSETAVEAPARQVSGVDSIASRRAGGLGLGVGGGTAAIAEPTSPASKSADLETFAPPSTAAAAPQAQAVDAPKPPAPGEPFRVMIQKTAVSKSLGLDIGQCKNPPGVVIAGVKEGLVKQWNTDNPLLQVEKNDLIIAANGVEGYKEMVTVIAEAQQIDLTLIKQGNPKGKPDR